MVFKYKAKKACLQTTIPENLDNNEDTKRDLHDLIHMGNRKRQDLLSKLGAWGPWGRFEGGRGETGRGEAERGAEKNVELNKY